MLIRLFNNVYDTRESNMERTNSSITVRGNMDNYINSQVLISDNMLLRDKVQSHRVHEPTSIESHTDPVTGNDVPYAENLLSSLTAY